MPTVQVIPGSTELQAIADTLGKSRKVVVVTGAGISTNCGIPDFRSENGLYSLIQAQYDAAAKNPPWEENNTHDIDDRPKKRRKPWYFYEVVAPGGQVVDVVGGDVNEDSKAASNVSSSKSTSNRSSRSRSASVSKTPTNCQGNSSDLRDLSDPPTDSGKATWSSSNSSVTQDFSLKLKKQPSLRSRSGSPVDSHTHSSSNPSGSSELSDPPSDLGEAPWTNESKKSQQPLKNHPSPRSRPESLIHSHNSSPANLSDSSELSDPPSDIGEAPWNSSEAQAVLLEIQPSNIQNQNPRRSSRRHPDLFTNSTSIDELDSRLDLLQQPPSSDSIPVKSTTSSAYVPGNKSDSTPTRKSVRRSSTGASARQPSPPNHASQLSRLQPQLPPSHPILALQQEPSSKSVSRSSLPVSSIPSRQSSPSPTITSQLSQPPTTASKPPLSSRSIHVLQREESSFISNNSDDVEPSTQSSQASRSSLPNLKGRDLFDSMVWSDAFTTSIFYMFISSLRQKIHEVKDTTETHKFIKVLRDGGRLVRNYTQNIDCLEEREGLVTEISRGPGNRSRFAPKTQREPRPLEISGDSAHNGGVEVVLLHGSLGQLRCGLCSRLSEWDTERGSVTTEGRAPDCPSCVEAHAKRTGRGRRGLAVGRLRPDIVLYGEEHPQAALVSPLVTHDLGLGPDVLLIMGTSLRVHGLKVMVREFAKAIHMKGGKVVFVNRTKPSESVWGDVIDYWVEWDCDEWVVDLKERRGDIWLPQGSVEDRRESLGDAKSKKGGDVADPSQPKKKKYEAPRCTRDEKSNGVYHTFKILDTLRSLEDENGQSTRKQYWVSRLSTSSFNAKSKTSGAELPSVKPPRKSLPSKPQTSKATPSQSSKTASQPVKTARKSTKRKSMLAPTTVPTPAISEDQTRVNLELAKRATWHDIRKINPSLPQSPPEISHAILQQQYADIPWLKANPTHPQNIDWKAFPTLLTHPPSGGLEIIHSPSRAVAPLQRPPPNHSYGTRASRNEGPPIATMMDGISPPLKPFGQIITSLDASNENRIPTPPESDPQTPVTNRDMSVGAILSSEKDDNESFKSSREETVESYDSVDQLKWYDSLERMEQ